MIAMAGFLSILRMIQTYSVVNLKQECQSDAAILYSRINVQDKDYAFEEQESMHIAAST